MTEQVEGKFKSALDILKEIKEKKKAEELKIKTKEIEVILIDYREQLRRYDVFAIDFDYILYFNKNNENYKEKLEKIIESLERMRPVRAKLLLKVDEIPVGPSLEMIENLTGDVVDIIEYETIEDILNTPIFKDKGTIGLSRTGNAKIRTDGKIYIISDASRNGERIKVLAQRGGVEILFSYARVRDSAGYNLVEGVYFVPFEDIRKMVEERKEEAHEKEKEVDSKVGRFNIEGE